MINIVNGPHEAVGSIFLLSMRELGSERYCPVGQFMSLHDAMRAANLTCVYPVPGKRAWQHLFWHIEEILPTTNREGA